MPNVAYAECHYAECRGANYLHVQQTPKPLAQDPAAVPPLLVHSDL